MNKREVLIVNLGSPESPSVEHVAAFLKEFLMDKFVLRMPYLLRYFLVNHIIVPRRVKYSAANYSKIWSDEYGSPIIYNTKELVRRLEERVLEGSPNTRSPNTRSTNSGSTNSGSPNTASPNTASPNREDVNITGVSFAMRYGKDSISKKIGELAAKGVKELLVIPMYPQCEGSTYMSTLDEVKRVAKREKIKVDFIPPFYKDSGYIAALADSVSKIIVSNNSNNNKAAPASSNLKNKLESRELDKLLISFHGVPIKYLPCGAKCAHSCKDPLHVEHLERKECSYCYKKECYTTAHLLAESLHLQRDEYEILFQSRLGGGEWISPYLSKWVENLSGEIDKSLYGKIDDNLSGEIDKSLYGKIDDNLSGEIDGNLRGESKRDGVKRVAVIAPSFTADCLETLYEINMESRELFLKSGGESFHYIPALNYSYSWVDVLVGWIKNS